MYDGEPVVMILVIAKQVFVSLADNGGLMGLKVIQ